MEKGEKMLSKNKNLNRKGAFITKIFNLCVLLSILAFFSYTILGVAEEKIKDKGKEKKKKEKTISDTEEFYRFVDLFNEVFHTVQEKYVEDISSEELLEAAINGMFLSLDSHSQFLDTDSLEQLEKDTEGEFSGIGIHISLQNGVLTVVAPIPGSPSAKLGIQPWDRIIEIEGKSTEGITLLEAVKKLTGPPGTKVSITIYREGELEPLHFTVTRASITVKSVYSKMLEDGIGYVRLAKFSENTAYDLKKVLIDFKGKGAKGLILDLRYNTGGLLKEAVEVSELLVPKDKIIVSTKGRIPNQNKEYKSRRDPILNVPIMVLVNRGSASASEIVAGAIKDLKIGVIVGPKGQKTFGKGSVQTIEDLRNSLSDDEKGNPRRSAIRLTTAKYYTPNDICIHGVGITPDIGVEITPEQERELAKHGLFGEPIMDEESFKKDKKSKELKSPKPGESETQTSPTLKLDENQLPTEEIPLEGKKEENIKEKDEQTPQTPEPTPEPFYLEKLGKTKEKKDKEPEFRDILLDEAAKILKAAIIFNSGK